MKFCTPWPAPLPHHQIIDSVSWHTFGLTINGLKLTNRRLRNALREYWRQAIPGI